MSNKTAAYQPIMARLDAFADSGDLHWGGSTGVYLRLRRERFVGSARAALLIEGLVMRDLDAVLSNPAVLPDVLRALGPAEGEFVVSHKVGREWERVPWEDAVVPGFPDAARHLAEHGAAGHLRISDDLAFVKLDVGGAVFDLRFLAGYEPPASVISAYDHAHLVMRTLKWSKRAYVEAAWACKNVLVFDTIMHTRIRPTPLTCSEALKTAFVEPDPDQVPDMTLVVHPYAMHAKIARNAYLRSLNNVDHHADPIVNAFIRFFAAIDHA